MNYILYSENYIKFFQHFEEGITSIEDCFDKIHDGMEHIAEPMHIGRFDICVVAPPNTYSPEGFHIDYPIYSHNGDYDTPPCQYPYETSEKGRIMFRVFPKKGYKFDEQDKEELKVLTTNIFFLCGRARLVDLMKKIVITDNITGMPNLSGFYTFAEKIKARGSLSKYHGICINIKNFKFINRSLFARRGDDILRDYAKEIGRFMKTNELFARIGGDSFIALIRDNRVNSFLKIISDVPVHTGANSEYIQLSARAGVYDIQDGDSIDDIINYADSALNIARSKGNDYVFFEHSMLENMLKSKEISARFPHAIQNQEFEVYYQPKVNILTNKVCGCEALVRWFRYGKMIPPMSFIPILENEGSICTLDFYVFERVCKTIKKWITSGITPVKVSTNFSRIHLHNPNLAEDILEIIERYGIDTDYIEIELTEMSGYDNYERLSEFIDTMRKHGVHTSIDDFGTGYSSLNLLTDLNVDVVKLDRSFANRLDNEAHKTKILIHNIINMVHELGFKVIAEGVETKEQAEFLSNIGCTIAQGYLYDKPLTLDEFETRLDKDFKYSV